MKKAGDSCNGSILYSSLFEHLALSRSDAIGAGRTNHQKDRRYTQGSPECFELKPGFVYSEGKLGPTIVDSSETRQKFYIGVSFEDNDNTDFFGGGATIRCDILCWLTEKSINRHIRA